jgi:hypothetical protein
MLNISRNLCRVAMSNLKIEGQGLSKTITLNDGYKMPMFGLGVYLSKPEETVNATATAIQNGYRLLDTAAFYE